MKAFTTHGWPGNIRQLTNILRTASVMTDEHETIEWDHLPDDFLDEWRALRLDAKMPTSQAAEAIEVKATSTATRSRPQFSVRSNFSVQTKGATFNPKPPLASDHGFAPRSKAGLFDVQVHRGHGSAVANKPQGLDQTFSKFREGRFDTRSHDARAQGYLGARQSATRAPIDNPINLDDLESRAIQEALETCRGNVSAAARMLGISRNTIYRRLNAK